MEELPYKNKDMVDLPNEKWVAAWGYNGLYDISSEGRIRSIDREIEYSDGRCRRHKGRILSQCKVKHGNTFSLFVYLANGDKTYSIKTIAALVLNSFKKPDIYNDCTHHLNTISYDNRLKNLAFEDLHTKRRIEYDKGVRDGHNNTRHWAKQGFLNQKTKEEMAEMRLLRPLKNRKYETRNKKIVTVFVPNNNFIGSYTCLKNASEQLDIKEYTLRNSLYHGNKMIQVKEGIFDIKDFIQC